MQTMQRTALYRLYGADGELLYVGISGWLDKRMGGHGAAQPWWKEVHHATVLWYETRVDADQAETEAIQGEHPKYNIAKAKSFRSRKAQDGKRPGGRVLKEDAEGLWVRVPPGVGVALDFDASPETLSSDAGFIATELVPILGRDGAPHRIPARYAHHF